MKITEFLKLSAFELDKDGQMFGRTWLSIFAGSGENNLKIIDDYAKKMNDTVTLIKNSPAVLSIDAKKETTGTYTADVPLIPVEKTDLTKDGIYIVSLDTRNETEAVTIRINGTITKQLKKIDQSGAVVDLEIGDFVAGLEHIFKYDGTQLVLINVNALTFMNHKIDDFVLKDEVVDSLDGNETNIPLSANQGRILKETVDTKAPIDSPTFTGTVSGIDNVMVGLENLTNDAQVKRSEMGAAGGVATLNESGQIPSIQLPSYVDDVLEFDGVVAFPAVGESGKIYVDTQTDLTYRWSGTQYVEISKSLALGETASTAYAGDKGKQNADDISDLKEQKVDKVLSAVEGNFPVFDATGNMIDSASSAGSFTPIAHESDNIKHLDATEHARLDTITDERLAKWDAKIGSVNGELPDDTGNLELFISSVAVQPEEPADSKVEVWIDTDEDSTPILPEDIGAVPNTRMVNGKSLIDDIVLSASDVGAVSEMRTINGNRLIEDIILSASDIGAHPNTWIPTAEEIGADAFGASSAVQENLNTHTNDSSAHVTLDDKQEWSNKANVLTFSIAVPLDQWSATKPYTQTITNSEITAAMSPIVDVVVSETSTIGITELKSFSYISYIKTYDGGIEIVCFEDKPIANLVLQLKVVK